MEKWIGKTLYGHCDGAFGRESYSDKTIEAIGKDWIVVREQSFGEVLIAQFSPENNQSVQETMENYLEIWSKEQETEEEDFYPEIRFISVEELKETISSYEKSAGMTLDEYKQAINDRKVKNYSAGHLSIWERHVQWLEERLKEEEGKG